MTEDAKDIEIGRLRRACHALAEALAKRCLEDANRDREAPNDWPSGQSWDDLGGTSKSSFRHRAWEEAGLGVNEMRDLLFDELGYPKGDASHV
jgi:hypothetical protein